MASEQLLQQAIAAYRVGHRGKARALLLAYVETDQQNELAWLLLSNLVNDLDDRIISLENALTINPHNTKAATQLWKLKRKRSQDPVKRVNDYQRRLEDAIEAKAKGQGLVAYSILRQLVHEDDRNEQAWLLLSELSPDTESEITALQNLLLLNPAHTAAKVRLDKLQRFRNDPLALGKLYEDWGEEEKARDLYVRVAFESSSMAERWEAERRMKNSAMREYAPGMRLVSPRVTLMRMTAGPIALYCALAFIHGGLNPLKISPLFWLGSLSVILGSLLVVVASTPNTRIIWQQVWAKFSDRTDAPQEGLQTLGVLLWMLPNCLIVLDGFLRMGTLF